jgi:exosome complex RNA-binding protein Rrp42 (RNase PH superfamily)
MPREAVVISNNERAFVLAALQEDQRIDGRRPFDLRRLRINFLGGGGPVEVQLGQTRVLAVVGAELAPPWPDRPNEGSLQVGPLLSTWRCGLLCKTWASNVAVSGQVTK